MSSSLAKPDEAVLSLILSEIWDLTAAIEELERRRDKLRDHALDLCRRGPIARYDHPRGSLKVERYLSYRVGKPSLLMPLLQHRGWEDLALTARGRSLHKLTARDPEARQWLTEHGVIEQRHETLVLTPKRGARR